MRRPLYAELSCGGSTVRLDGLVGGRGLHVTSEGIEGWWSTPDPKWSLTERQSADGAHWVAEGMALYAARTVTVHAVAIGADRDDAKELLDSVLAMAHGRVRLRVVDSSEDTFCDGLLSVRAGAEWHPAAILADLTVTCPDPRRLATAPSDAWRPGAPPPRGPGAAPPRAGRPAPWTSARGRPRRGDSTSPGR